MRRLIQAALATALLFPAACSSQKDATTDDAQVAETPERSPGDAKIVYSDGTYDYLSAAEMKKHTRPVQNLTLFFSHDSASLDDRDRTQLERVHQWMLANPEVTLIIEGHTSKPGDPDYNESLGQARAMAARRHLMALGIEEERIVLLSHGEEDAGERLASPGADRRVEFSTPAGDGSDAPINPPPATDPDVE